MNSRNALIVLLLCLCCGAAGYARGVSAEAARGRARLAEQAETASREAEARAVATAEAERFARRRLEEETARAAAVAGELSETRSRLAAERRAFNRRMIRVSEEASRRCAGLSADWVRLYNEALGLAPVKSVPSASAAGAGAAAGSAPAAGSGLQPGTPVTASPEDLLAHVRDYGGYCRSLRAQTEALLSVQEGAKP